MKQNIVLFIAVFVFVYASTDCKACFTNNYTYSAIFKTGSPFYQECRCETPTGNIRNLKWLDGNNQEISTLKGPGTQHLGYTEWASDRLNLYIPSLSKSLSGVYKCVTETDGKRYALSHEINVYDPLTFFNTPDKQALVKGKNSMITCQVKADSAPRIDWMKGEYEITNNDKYEFMPNGLLIKNVTVSDDGVYTCIVNVAGTGENDEKYIAVEVNIAPTIVNLVANPAAIVEAGDLLSLECRARGFPLPQYSWNKTSDTTNDTDRNITWRQDYNKIVFDNATEEDRGTYECVAWNEAGEARQQITVEILTRPKIADFQNLTVEEGTSANLTCKAIGRPRPVVLIGFEDSINETIPHVTNMPGDIETEVSLMFLKVNRSYEGFYYCNASNEVGYEIEDIYVSVLYKPSFTENVAHIWAWNGKEINIECEHDSRPPADVTWRYLGTSNEIHPAVPHCDINQVSQNSSLRIANNCYGAYECTAKNHLGEAKKTFLLIKAFAPYEVNYVTWEIAATSVIFSIRPPKVIGPALIGYTAEYDEERNYNITNIHLNRTWAVGITYKIDKLKPNMTYLVRFAGINEVGTGKFGKFFKFQTPAKSIPEPPTWDLNSEIVEIQTHNKMLKLKSPEHNGDPIDYYAIKYCRVDKATCIENIVSPTNELKLDHLEHNSTYQIEIVAHNSVGNSSATYIEITMPAKDMSLAEEAKSAGVIIGMSAVVVVACIVLLDVVLCAMRRQGMVANCYYKNNKKRKQDGRRSRDKKGLLKDNSESVAGDTMKRSDNGHKEPEYNRTTGVITGKHSAV